MNATKAKVIGPGSDVVTSPTAQRRTRMHGPGSRNGRKRTYALLPTAMAVGGGVMLQQANLTALSFAAAVMALAVAPALWQLSRRIRRFNRSTDGVMLMEFEEAQEAK